MASTATGCAPPSGCKLMQCQPDGMAHAAQQGQAMCTAAPEVVPSSACGNQVHAQHLAKGTGLPSRTQDSLDGPRRHQGGPLQVSVG